MNDEKITRELAEQEFVSYCESNDIDCDESAMNEEDADAFKPIKESFIKACRAGRVVVDGKNLEYTISDFSPQGYAGNKLTIGRPNGSAMLAMDGYKDTQSMHKLQEAQKEALKRHHAAGPPSDWQARFVSAYASVHPWEDWAESFAHYG